MSTLFVIGTPIGNLEDTTARAVRVLGEVGAIAAEDTRITARLLARHGIRKPLISYRAPVERRGLPRVLAALDEHDVALVSDAGTPTVSDPGQALVEAAWAAGHTVVPIPGPSAVTAPSRSPAMAARDSPSSAICRASRVRCAACSRRWWTTRVRRSPSTRPIAWRNRSPLIAEVLPDRHLTVGRELTKLHEEVLRGTAAEVGEALGDRARGEFTLVISGAN